MEEYCIENKVELFHIRQISMSEAHLKAFHCVFKFEEEKAELRGLKTLRCQDFT